MLFYKRITLLAAMLFAVSPAFAQGFDHSALDRFLKQYVDSNGRVNYVAAKQNRADLDQYLDSIKNMDISVLKAGPRQEHLAFWLNAYHAGLLKLVLENYPLKSTQDVPSFWDRQFFQVGVITKNDKANENDQINATNKKKQNDKIWYGLSQIRNELLIQEFKDEKVHFALALGAKDGPLFPREVFTGPRVLGQLFKCARREVNRPEMVQVDPTQGTVKLSRVFDWYSPDLIKNFGRPERRGKLSRTDTAIVNFLIRFLKKIDKIKFLKSTNYKIEYASFDWALNDTTAA